MTVKIVYSRKKRQSLLYSDDHFLSLDIYYFKVPVLSTLYSYWKSEQFTDLKYCVLVLYTMVVGKVYGKCYGHWRSNIIFYLLSLKVWIAEAIIGHLIFLFSSVLGAFIKTTKIWFESWQNLATMWYRRYHCEHSKNRVLSLVPVGSCKYLWVVRLWNKIIKWD